MAPPISGYLLWLDATQIAQSDNTAVSSWPDESGNGYNGTQSSGTNKPTFYSSTTAKLINGHPVVYFNGTSDFVNCAIPTETLPLTVYLVLRADSLSANHYIFSPDNSGNRFEFGASSSNAWNIFDGSNLSGGTVDGNAHVLTVQNVGSGNKLIRVDGTQVASGATGGNGFTGGGLNIGTVYTAFNGFYWSGPMGEIIVYTAAHTTTQMQSTESYLTNRWLSTPTYFPFRSSFVPLSRASSW